MDEKKISFEFLLGKAKAIVAVKEKKKALVQDAAHTRVAEVGDLQWPIDDERYWKPVGIRLVYESQTCRCCGLRNQVFAQELVGFKSTRQPTTMRWLRGRGEALEAQLPTSCEIIDRFIPLCWECHQLEKTLESLWTALTKEKAA